MHHAFELLQIGILWAAMVSSPFLARRVVVKALDQESVLDAAPWLVLGGVLVVLYIAVAVVLATVLLSTI